jgi:hypothetical protein
MGMMRTAALCGVVLASGVMVATPAGAVATKATKAPKDPCAVMTDADMSALSGSYTISDTVSELDGNCTYTLEHDGPTLVQLFVESPIGYKAQKAVTSKVKKVSGLPGGYSGQLSGGSHEVAYKSGKTAIRLSSNDVSSADLIKMLESIQKRIG